jgi:hypothetical protein
MWKVSIKYKDKSPFVELPFVAASSHEAWEAFTAWRLMTGVVDYHSAMVWL